MQETSVYNPRWHNRAWLAIRAAVEKDLGPEAAQFALNQILDAAEHCAARQDQDIEYPGQIKRFVGWRDLPHLLHELSLDTSVKVMTFLALFAAGSIPDGLEEKLGSTGIRHT